MPACLSALVQALALAAAARLSRPTCVLVAASGSSRPGAASVRSQPRPGSCAPASSIETARARPAQLRPHDDPADGRGPQQFVAHQSLGLPVGSRLVQEAEKTRSLAIIEATQMDRDRQSARPVGEIARIGIGHEVVTIAQELNGDPDVAPVGGIESRRFSVRAGHLGGELAVGGVALAGLANDRRLDVFDAHIRISGLSQILLLPCACAQPAHDENLLHAYPALRLDLEPGKDERGKGAEDGRRREAHFAKRALSPMGLPVAVGQVVEEVDRQIDKAARRRERHGVVRPAGDRCMDGERQSDAVNVGAVVRGASQVAVEANQCGFKKFSLGSGCSYLSDKIGREAQRLPAKGLPNCLPFQPRHGKVHICLPSKHRIRHFIRHTRRSNVSYI